MPNNVHEAMLWMRLADGRSMGTEQLCVQSDKSKGDTSAPS